MSDMSSVVHFEMPPAKGELSYEPDKWTYPALEVPGLWAGHESRVVVPPATVARVSSPFFVLATHDRLSTQRECIAAEGKRFVVDGGAVAIKGKGAFQSDFMLTSKPSPSSASLV